VTDEYVEYVKNPWCGTECLQMEKKVCEIAQRERFWVTFLRWLEIGVYKELRPRQ